MTMTMTMTMIMTMTMTKTITMTMIMIMTMTMTKRYKLGIQYNKYKDRQINQIVIIEQNDILYPSN